MSTLYTGACWSPNGRVAYAYLFQICTSGGPKHNFIQFTLLKMSYFWKVFWANNVFGWLFLIYRCLFRRRCFEHNTKYLFIQKCIDGYIVIEIEETLEFCSFQWLDKNPLSHCTSQCTYLGQASAPPPKSASVLNAFLTTAVNLFEIVCIFFYFFLRGGLVCQWRERGVTFGWTPAEATLQWAAHGVCVCEGVGGSYRLKHYPGSGLWRE